MKTGKKGTPTDAAEMTAAKARAAYRAVAKDQTPGGIVVAALAMALGQALGASARQGYDLKLMLPKMYELVAETAYQHAGLDRTEGDEKGQQRDLVGDCGRWRLLPQHQLYVIRMPQFDWGI